MLRNADVAKILPCVPAAMTATEATNTIKSAWTGRVRSWPAPRTNPPCVRESEVGSWDRVGDWEVPLGQCQQPGLGQGWGQDVNPGAWGQGSGEGKFEGKALGFITDDTERFSGEAEAALPSSVAAAAPSRPDTDDVLQAKHDDHHEFLWGQGLSSPQAPGPGLGPAAQKKPGVPG